MSNLMKLPFLKAKNCRILAVSPGKPSIFFPQIDAFLSVNSLFLHREEYVVNFLGDTSWSCFCTEVKKDSLICKEIAKM